MRALARRLFAIRGVPTSVVVITAAISYVAQMIAIVQGWPLWAIVGVTLLPWVPLFTRDRDLVAATERAQVLRFRAGEDVVLEGDPADRFYIVTKGELAVSRGEGPIERPLRTLGPGDHFGEIGLLAGAPRSATVRTLTEVELLAFDRKVFGTVVANSEATARDLARIAQERLAT